VHALTEALRRELGPKGVRVSLIEPGIVESGFQDAAGYDPSLVKSFNEKFGPLLKPKDIADTVTFLLSLPPHVNVNEIMIRATRQDYP
jgi:NADP-dependent 3-hydroxy acid dehydrogenase YdfG